MRLAARLIAKLRRRGYGCRRRYGAPHRCCVIVSTNARRPFFTSARARSRAGRTFFGRSIGPRHSSPWRARERRTLDGEEVASIVDAAMGHKVGGPRHYVRADGTEVVAEALPEGESLSEVAE